MTQVSAAKRQFHWSKINRITFNFYNILQWHIPALTHLDPLCIQAWMKRPKWTKYNDWYYSGYGGEHLRVDLSQSRQVAYLQWPLAQSRGFPAIWMSVALPWLTCKSDFKIVTSLKRFGLQNCTTPLNTDCQCHAYQFSTSSTTWWPPSMGWLFCHFGCAQ